MPKKNTISVIGVVTTALLTFSVGPGAAAAAPGPSETGPATTQPASSGHSTGACSANSTSTAGAEQRDTIDMTQIDGAPAEQLAADVTALIDSGPVTMHAPAEALVRDGAKAYQVKTGGEQHQITSVTFPISGSYSEPLSNLTVLFNADGAVV